MRTIRLIKVSPNPPETNTLWLNEGVASYFNNGMWVRVGQDTPYVLPEASITELGGVRQGVAVTDLATDASLEDVVNKMNALLSSLRGSGLLTI